jgi:hypothetical protein
MTNLRVATIWSLDMVVQRGDRSQREGVNPGSTISCSAKKISRTVPAKSQSKRPFPFVWRLEAIGLLGARTFATICFGETLRVPSHSRRWQPDVVNRVAGSITISKVVSRSAGTKTKRCLMSFSCFLKLGSGVDTSHPPPLRPTTPPRSSPPFSLSSTSHPERAVVVKRVSLP